MYVEPKDFLRNTSRWRICTDENLYFNCSCNSTMVLPKGKYDWYSPGLFMSPDAASVFNTFSSKASIPYIPAVSIELGQKLKEQSTALSDIAATCKRDPALAAQLMTIANAARKPGTLLVTSIEQALGLLGRSRVISLCQIAALSLFEFKTTVYTKQIHFLEAFTTGYVAERLALKLAPEISPEVAYVCGTFCNIGRLLGAIVFPEVTDRLYTSTISWTKPRRWTQAESEMGEVGHTILGEIASVLWGMSDEVFRVVQNHHQLLSPRENDLPSVSCDLNAIISFSNQVCHLLLLNSQRVDDAVLESSLSYFGLSHEKLEELVKLMRPAVEHARISINLI
jgi:HD-like signal output (HDOD) protein